MIIGSYNKIIKYFVSGEMNLNLFFFGSSDVVTKEEAIDMLKAKQAGKEDREELMRTVGYPAYTTQAGKSLRDTNQSSIFIKLFHKRNIIGSQEKNLNQNWVSNLGPPYF